MNTFLKWVRENLALPLGMALLTATVAGVYETTEINGQQYAALGRMYIGGTDRYRANLETIAEKGAISKWSFSGLQRDYWVDSSALALPINDQLTVNEERAALLEQIRNKARPPSK